MPRRKKPSDIYLAWDRIVFGNDKYSSESQQAWAALWEQHCVGGRLAKTAIADVELLASLGYDLAAKQGDWQAAKERVECYFQHPHWQTDCSTSQEMLQVLRARAYWECGDEDGALNLFRGVSEQPSYGSISLMLVWEQLCVLCQEQPEDIIVSARLAHFILEIAQRVAKRSVSDKVLTFRSFGELAVVLESARTARAKKA